jgi:Flp pilus assembly protein TadD
MLYEFLEGKPPYSSEQILTMMKGDRLDPAPALERLGAHLPEAVVALVERAIEPDPDCRFQTAIEMNEAVRVAAEAVQAGHAPAARTRLASGAVPVAPAARSGNRPGRSGQRQQVTASAPVLAVPPARRRPSLFAISAVCWLLVLVAMGWLAHHRSSSDSSGPVPVPVAATQGAGSASPALPVSVPASMQPTGLDAEVALVRAGLLAERELPMTVTSQPGAELTTLEVTLAARGELEQAELRWESSASSLAISEVNGRQTLLQGERVPLSLLRDGNNTFSFAGSLRRPSRTPAMLVIRRGAGASMIVPPAPANTGASGEASRGTRRLMKQAQRDYESGRYGEAILKCDEAARLDPGSWEASWRRAIAVHFLSYLSRGLRASTGLDLLTSANIDPETSRLDAFDGFNHALALRPSEGNIWYDLGWACRDYSRLADAERMLSMSVVLDRPEPRYWWELSRTLAQRVPAGQERDSGKLQLALRAAKAAFATKGELKPGWLCERGFLFRRAGRLEEARQDFRTALERDPADRVARQGLESLGGR